MAAWHSHQSHEHATCYQITNSNNSNNNNNSSSQQTNFLKTPTQTHDLAAAVADAPELDAAGRRDSADDGLDPRRALRRRVDGERCDGPAQPVRVNDQRVLVEGRVQAGRVKKKKKKKKKKKTLDVSSS
jgi:hypothetical protein